MPMTLLLGITIALIVSAPWLVLMVGLWLGV